MPTLQFKGKNIIWNHHLSVPYHALESVSKLSFQPEKANGNLIVEGDNLLALKALLPLYSGQVKCIYIDPPYNTGNEKWIYNDNVNSPLLKDWLGKEVAKDDLTRHDKWLCMMTPRLKLLRDLLSEDGVIFISIDENEQHNLVAILDEIFGEENHLATLVWAGRGGKGGTTKQVEYNHEFVLMYSKNYEKCEVKPITTVVTNGNYEDKIGKYKREQLRQWGQGDKREDRPFMYFPIIAPDGTEVYPKRSDGSDGRWRFGEESVKRLLSEDGLDFAKNGDGLWTVYRKIRVGKENVTANDSLLLDFGTASTGTIELKRLFSEKVFDTVKPIALIKHLVDLVTYNSPSSVVLDSFAGSGTTAQAVMDLNKEDEGNRKYILVQMSEASPAEPKKNICKDITSERVKRAIKKFEYDSGFEYMRVGVSMDAESLLSGNLPAVESFGSYIFHLCTGEKTSKPVKLITKYLYMVGSQGHTDIYLIYSQDYEELTRLALNLDVAEKITSSKQKRTVVYAPACFLDEDYLRAKQIEFVNIPYGLFQRKGNEA